MQMQKREVTMLKKNQMEPTARARQTGENLPQPEPRNCGKNLDGFAYLLTFRTFV
jgi:hypothetical protein